MQNGSGLSGRRRVVVTGIGCVTAAGSSPDSLWESVVEGRSAIRPVSRFDTSPFRTRIAATIDDFNVDKYLSGRERVSISRASQYAIFAAQEAALDAGIEEGTYDDEHCGVFWGIAYGAPEHMEQEYTNFRDTGRIIPYITPMVMHNAPAYEIAKRLKVRGMNLSFSTACSSSNHAIGTAFHMVRSGMVEMAVAGGSEAPVTPFNIQAWCELRGAMSTRNESPSQACRPFSRDREGMVLGEGSGALILEDLESARRRGAHIYAEIVGYGTSCDTDHVTLPTAQAQAKAMKTALYDGEVPIECVNYVNAHGTGTKPNDKAETEAIKLVFGDHASRLLVNSSKPLVGHLIGASGAVELIISVLSMKHSMVHPTINRSEPDTECDLDYVVEGPRKTEINGFVSNSFAFGGSNASLAVRRYELAS